MFDTQDEFKAAFRKALDNTKRKIPLWNIYSNFLDGRQDPKTVGVVPNENGTVAVVPTYDRRGPAFVSVNQISGFFNAVYAQLESNYPSIKVAGNTPSMDDLSKAKAAESVIRNFWATNKVDRTISEAIRLLTLYGTSGLYVTYINDVEIHAVPPEHLIIDNKAKSLRYARFTGVRIDTTKAQLLELYPDSKEVIEDYYESEDSFNKAGECTCAAYDVFVPSEQRAHIILGNGEILYSYDYDPKYCPLQIMKYRDSDGSAWGQGLVEPLIDLQMIYNTTYNKWNRNISAMALPKIMAQAGSITIDSFTDTPGEIINVNRGYSMPTLLPGASISSDVVNMLNQTYLEMQRVSGIYSTALGKREVNQSGKAIEALTNNSVSQLQPVQNGIEAAVATCAACILKLVKDHWGESKYSALFDQFGFVIHDDIEDLSIMENPEVTIQAGTMFRNELQDRENKTLQMFQAGLIDKEEARNAMQWSSPSTPEMEKLVDVAEAKAILQAVIQGHPVEIFKSDNLVVFSKVFKDFMRNKQYYTLDPVIQTTIRNIYVACSKPPSEYTAEIETVFPHVAPTMPVQAPQMPLPATDPDTGMPIQAPPVNGLEGALEDAPGGNYVRQ